MRTKTLWVRPEYLAWILAGLKTVEVRVGYPNIARLQAGDRLLLNDAYPYRVVRAGRYPDIAALLAAEDPAAIVPDLSAGQLLAALRELYPPEKEALGVFALQLEPWDTPVGVISDGQKAQLDAGAGKV